ncbi:MAG: ABC transporter ATP-binding protein [Halanaerobiales bacterium]|nr:ABC transporter ATP-binding protein [Halanaerobiales bacterium]
MIVERLLEINDLHFSFLTYGGEVKAVRGISFQVKQGEKVALVGESGSGKSVTAQCILKLNPEPPGFLKKGSILFDGQNITEMNEKGMRKIRGHDIGMIFQDPLTSLNPTMKVGEQITEGLLSHHGFSRKNARKRAYEMLKMVGIADYEKRFKQYPYQFSGGMKQRVMIAIALIHSPRLLIADEPTTSLDVTIEAQILDLMDNLQQNLKTAIILITHDLGVVARLCERVLVIYGGKIVEAGDIDNIYYQAKHPYTWGLLKSIPRLDHQKSKKLGSIEGTPPDLFEPPAGCPFAARCQYAMRVCYQEEPAFFPITAGHQVACWLLHPDAPESAKSTNLGVF